MKIMSYKTKLNDEKGATSVLVIFMLMVLATIGAFIITSANANYKLSQRALEWNKMFYGLDAKGEEFLFALDGRLAEARRTFLDAVSVGDNTETPVYSGDNALFNEYAIFSLQGLSYEYTDFEVYVPENEDPLSVSVIIRSDYPSMENCCLKISVNVEPISLTTAESDGTVVVPSESDARYRITEWSEYQEATVKEESGNGLWDGTFK